MQPPSVSSKNGWPLQLSSSLSSVLTTMGTNHWQVYLASPVKAIEVPPGAAVEEAAVLSPDLLTHFPSVVDKADKALDPESRACDGERGHLCSCRKRKFFQNIHGATAHTANWYDGGLFVYEIWSSVLDTWQNEWKHTYTKTWNFRPGAQSS